MTIEGGSLEEPEREVVRARNGVVDESVRFGTPAFYAAVGKAFVAMCAVVPVLALIEVLDQALGGRLDRAGGIVPRRLDGLDGIVLAPFLHFGFDHLVANSAPLILIGTFVLAAGTRRFVLSTLIIMFISGLGTWLFTTEGHIVVGASGVIFGYLGVMLVRGIIEHSLWNILAAVLTGLLYGWQLVGVLPAEGSVSWQAHLFGFIGGLIAAVLIRRRRGGGLAQVTPVT